MPGAGRDERLQGVLRAVTYLDEPETSSYLKCKESIMSSAWYIDDSSHGWWWLWSWRQTLSCLILVQDKVASELSSILDGCSNEVFPMICTASVLCTGKFYGKISGS